MTAVSTDAKAYARGAAPDMFHPLGQSGCEFPTFESSAQFQVAPSSVQGVPSSKAPMVRPSPQLFPLSTIVSSNDADTRSWGEIPWEARSNRTSPRLLPVA